MEAMRAWLVATFWILSSATIARGEVELKNDGFESGGVAGFQGGFVAGEIGASRFVAPEAGRQLLRVHLLFGGGSTATRTVTLKVWDDSAGELAPGTELFSGDYQLTGSDSAMHELVLPGQTVVPAQFRVGVEFQHAGAPSIARDADNTIDAAKNYIFASGGLGWQRSATFGVTGDWVIRAIVSAGDGMVPDGPPGGGGGACSGNAECPVGQFCDTANGACTFECRVDDDCGGGICNTLGQCVGGPEGGGCCQSDAGRGELGMIVLGLGVVGFGFVRRRRCDG
jgi:hypothetical protein